MTVETVPRSAFALRHAEVLRTARPTPNTMRMTLGGPDLWDLPVTAADGYLKVFFPRYGEIDPVLPPMGEDGDVGAWYRSYLAMPADVKPPMRTYTLRRRRDDAADTEIDVDVVLHDVGPGRDWALTARIGERVAFTGPYGLYAPQPAHDGQLLVGDASAVPAVAAIVEGLPHGVRVDVVLEVPSPRERQVWDTAGHADVSWVHGGATSVLDAVRDRALPGERPYAWLAGEATLVRDLRRHLTRERGVDKRDITFCGYWRRGRSEDQEVAAAMAGETPEED